MAHLDEMDCQVCLALRGNLAVLHSKEKWVFQVTQGYQVFLEKKAFLDLLALVHKAYLVRRVSKVYLAVQALLVFQVQKVSLARLLQNQEFLVPLVLQEEMVTQVFQEILVSQVSVVYLASQVQRESQVFLALDFQVHQAQRVSQGLQAHPELQELQVALVWMDPLDHLVSQDRRETVDLEFQDHLGPRDPQA